MKGRLLALAGVVLTAIWMGLLASPVHADGNPAVTKIALDKDEPCAKVCFTVLVDNPAPGTIELRLTGHRPSTGDTWVDLAPAVPHITIDIVAGQKEYKACFDDATQAIAGQGFNTLRIDIVKSTPNITGTDTKSDSFMCTGGGGQSPSPSPGHSPSPSPSPSPGGGLGAGSSPTTSVLAETGGLNYPIVGLGALVLLAGLGLLFYTIRRRRQPQS